MAMMGSCWSDTSWQADTWQDGCWGNPDDATTDGHGGTNQPGTFPVWPEKVKPKLATPIKPKDRTRLLALLCLLDEDVWQ